MNSERVSAIVMLVPVFTMACVFDFRFDEHASFGRDADATSSPDGTRVNEAAIVPETSSSGPDAQPEGSTIEPTMDTRASTDAVAADGSPDSGGYDGPPFTPDTPDAAMPDTAMPDTAIPDAAKADAVAPDALPPKDTGLLPDAVTAPDSTAPVDAASETP